MREKDNIINNNINSGASALMSVRRAVRFGDIVNDSNEVEDNNNNNNDNYDNNPTTVSENNDIPVDEETGSNVNSSEQNTVHTRPEIIDDDDCPVPFNSAQYEVPLPSSQTALSSGYDEKLMKKLDTVEQMTKQTQHEPITKDEEVNMRMVNAKIGREYNEDFCGLSGIHHLNHLNSRVREVYQLYYQLQK